MSRIPDESAKWSVSAYAEEYKEQQSLLATVAGSVLFMTVALGSPEVIADTESLMTQATPLSAEVVQQVVEAAVKRLSVHQGVTRNQLRVLNSFHKTFPRSGRNVVRIKALNEVSGEVSTMSVDEAGESVSPEQLQDEEDKLVYGEEYKKIHPSLAEKVKKQISEKTAELIRVIVWLREDKGSKNSTAGRVSRAELENDLGSGLSDKAIAAKVHKKRADVLGPVIENAKDI